MSETMPESDVELLRLASADNFRDVAGPGHATRDGATMRRGVVYRSNELLLSPEDVERVVALGVTDIVDLREAAEIEAHPDAVVGGATWVGLPVTGIPSEIGATLPDVESAEAAMCLVYRRFVEVPENRASFGALLRMVATSSTPQLFHCTAGKDRTGWAAVLLQHVAGLPEDVVRREYLLTNEISSATRTKYLGLVEEHLGSDRVPVYERTMVADLSYLEAAHAAVGEHYGDLDRYLRDGLGLDDDLRVALRARLVE